MYFLRSNKPDIRDDGACEVDMSEILNSDVIKSAFSEAIRTAMSEVVAKMKDLHDEVVMLRESNVELINLLTNKGAMHNIAHPNNPIGHSKTSVNCNAEETKHPAVGNKNKNESSQKTSNYKKEKPEQK
ncbi:unnamed protein product [Acanthoscelides obtectus]|uniref:Uncharacterized protein n=1 Tax=Acanthoscelides obtectus TaxID=200917 RepID=A0A9P0NWC4_ACAOB|nr:unnamed protein product [Acanthoscelides obtectus]CAK1663839.1 hypothetical protein AOBTE_LOCUS23885 [Acanthoscelides obtectus]